MEDGDMTDEEKPALTDLKHEFQSEFQDGERSLRPAETPRRGAGTGLFIGLLMALCAWLAWQAFGPEDNGDPISTSVTAFQKQNQLTVFSAQLAVIVSAEDSRFYGTLNSRQVAVIPANVAYHIDLSAMDADDFGWNESTEVLTVTLPALEIGKPNLDEARAQYLREGILITRDAQDDMTRDNTQLAEEQAIEQASNPQLIALARAAAIDAIATNLSIPLQLAGYGDVRVEVVFEE